MKTATLCGTCFVCFTLVGLAAAMHAAGTVRLELVGDSRSAMAFQQWAQALGKAGIRDVRFSTAAEPEKPAIDVQGAPGNPLYVVRGIVRSADEIELPGARFRRGEIERLRQWLADLAERGPPQSREKTVAFGLTGAELDKLRGQLAPAVGFATKDMTVRDMVRRLANDMPLRLELDAATADDLDKVKLTDDLAELSRGTALACALRAAGHGWRPKTIAGKQVAEVVKLAADGELWPAGWDADDVSHELLPGMYEFHNVNVQNIAASEVAATIGRNVRAAVVFDQRALARHEIDPAAKVSLPQARTTYSIALRKLLFQARLKFEIRRDESGMGFLWITTLKPVADRK
jgi:hypothetical protein